MLPCEPSLQLIYLEVEQQLNNMESKSSHWELEEHFGNLMRTPWEHGGNSR
jgi:hypothetical protein